MHNAPFLRSSFSQRGKESFSCFPLLELRIKSFLPPSFLPLIVPRSHFTHLRGNQGDSQRFLEGGREGAVIAASGLWNLCCIGLRWADSGVVLLL